MRAGYFPWKTAYLDVSVTGIVRLVYGRWSIVDLSGAEKNPSRY